MSIVSADISKLMLALLNGGEAGDARILSAASVNAMMAPPGISENGFPDSAYGFGAVAREGWNSLERDSRTGVVAARLVLVP